MAQQQQHKLSEVKSDLEGTKVQLRNVMNRIIDDRVGGEGTEALRVVRNRDPPKWTRVNSFWLYTLTDFQDGPLPVVPVLCYLAYACAVISFCLYYLEPRGELDTLKNEKPELKDVASLIGLAVFLLLAFRNNSAYGRWWEGATRWYDCCGSVLNAARQVAAISPPDKAIDLLWWLFSTLYCAKQQLRSSRRVADYSLLEEALPPALWAEIADRHDKFHWSLFRYGQLASKIDLPGKTEGKACEEVMKCANPILAAYTACWRLVRTPMPPAYLVHLRSFLLLWLAILPWAFSPTYKWWGVLLCAAIGWAVLGVEEAAVELESCFGHDRNDLNMDEIAHDAFAMISEFILHAGFDEDGRSLSAKGEAMC